MAHLLLASATEFEIALALQQFNVVDDQHSLIRQYTFGQHTIDVLITGAGMVNMAFGMGLVSGTFYDRMINAGICGSFRQELGKGCVVQVSKDVFSELGAEDGDAFLPMESLNLGASHYEVISFETPVLKNLPKATGITVNTVHGRESSIVDVAARFNPDVETMEGAAFLRATVHYQTPALQLKAVSNMVERRNRAAWDIPLAIGNLNQTLLQILQEIH